MEEKLEQAAKIINNSGFISVKDLTLALGVTRGTTDRYLQSLEAKGLIRRVQGGAIALRRDFDFCPSSYYSDVDKHFQERAAVGRKAAELLNERDSVFIGGGRTALHLAQAIRERQIMVTVVTNSLPVALSLSGACAVNVAGFSPTDGEGIMIGPETLSHPVGKAFVAPGGITPDGFFNATQLIVRFERAFVVNAKKTVILADREAYGEYRPYKLCDYDEVDIIVTPANPPEFINHQNLEAHYADEL